ERLPAPTAATVPGLAAHAGPVADEARSRLELDVPGSSVPTTLAMADAAAGFGFPDEAWARVLYDLIVTARNEPDRVDAFVAPLVPIYFGRVASFVVDNRDRVTER